ncbi:hypothetical protein Bca52824_026192 [Brassica carinata]|uniref:DUF287 domain-containing protein n=1 Tax=Brassica carinata TaxID=52824 RepID=A0A8X7SKV9_BRACI|nr:hypothetical protein Bca52824_026192 [Brassica carinata]
MWRSAGPSPPPPPATPAIGNDDGSDDGSGANDESEVEADENEETEKGDEDENDESEEEGNGDREGDEDEERSENEGSEEENGDGEELPNELLAFEAIPKLGLAFREDVEGADPNCPRMCKSYFKRNGMTGFSLSLINKELGNTTDIHSIIPTKCPREERLLDYIMEDEDDVDKPDIAVDSWDKCLDAGEKVFFPDMFEEDVAGRSRQPDPIEDAVGDAVEVGEQSIQLGDVMKLVKRTFKLLSTVEKKVDQLDERLAPLEEFVKEARGEAAEDVEDVEGQRKKTKKSEKSGKSGKSGSRSKKQKTK